LTVFTVKSTGYVNWLDLLIYQHQFFTLCEHD
jgi:hypothetical protein